MPTAWWRCRPGSGALRIQPIDNAASQPSRVGSSGASRNSFVTEVVRLRAIDAQSALDTVRPLVSAQGSVTANRAGNSLVIVDFGDNIRRIRQVLARIDTDSASTRVVTLKNASAKEIAAALSGLGASTAPAGAAGSAATASGQGASVVAVESSNSIVIRGDASSVARLAQVAIDLDQKARNGTEIKVVFLENADAEQLLPVLQQLVGQTPRCAAADSAVTLHLRVEQQFDRARARRRSSSRLRSNRSRPRAVRGSQRSPRRAGAPPRW